MISFENLHCPLLNLGDHPIKWEHKLKNNRLWKAFVHICLLFVQDENQDKLMQ